MVFSPYRTIVPLCALLLASQAGAVQVYLKDSSGVVKSCGNLVSIQNGSASSLTVNVDGSCLASTGGSTGGDTGGSTGGSTGGDTGGSTGGDGGGSEPPPPPPSGGCADAQANNPAIVCKGADYKFEGGGTIQGILIKKSDIHVWSVDYKGDKLKGGFSLTDGNRKEVSISTSPGDFSAPIGVCHRVVSRNGGLYWAESGSANSAYQCPLRPGTTYYINIRTVEGLDDGYNYGHF